MPWENGEWFGRMTEEQKTAGGIWVIGDKPYDSSPDYPGKNNGDLLMKSWVANPVKYTDYLVKDRLDTGHWEYVRVMTQRLDCKIHQNPVLTYPLMYPDEGVDMSPEVKRRWYMSNGMRVATGITLLRQLERAPFKAGAGPGYEYWLWDTDSTYFRLPFDGPLNLQEWDYRYIEVFSGRLAFFHFCKGAWKDRVELKAGDHVFCKPDLRKFVQLGEKARGIVLYF